MFCPECGGEYRSGFTICADCQVPLVDSLDEVATEEGDESSLESILSTRDPEELGALAELLEEARIPYVLHAGTAMPLEEDGHLADGEPDYWEARLFVHGPRREEGERLLAALRAQRGRHSS